MSQGDDTIDQQSRKWQITINNPIEKNLTHTAIKELIHQFKPLVYYCMSDEIGLEEQTPHTHLYLAFKSAVRFSTIKNKFSTAHIELAKGTSQQNRDYVFKEGKWLTDKKSETNLIETHEEGGELPIERQGARNDLADLYDMIKQGMSDYDILEETPQYLTMVDKIEKIRQTILEEKYKNEFRSLRVTYIFGETSTGKTRSVMEKYGYQNVYRVTDYLHPFDSYKAQDVIIFEEFRNSLRISDMLIYLDGYPATLPCRYNNRTACYTNVYLISNINITEQYEEVQRNSIETWKAFLRRIHEVQVFSKSGVEIFTMENYFKDFHKITSLDAVPFKETIKNGKSRNRKIK